MATNRGYPLRAGTDPWRIPEDINDLAAAIDGDVAGVEVAASAAQAAADAHAARHGAAGPDPVTITPAQVTGTAVVQARQITAGTGLTGGGDLSADRTLAVAYGTSAGTAAQGNDARLSDTRTPTDGSVTEAKIATGAVTSAKIADGTIVDADISGSAGISPAKIAGTAVVQARSITTTAPLTGGGDLSADRTLGVSVGTTAGTVAAGDDARITGAVQKSTVIAKGDLLAATAADTVVRHAAGADGYALTADTTASTGLRWLPSPKIHMLYLPGTTTDFVQCPDSAALGITGDIDVRVLIKADTTTMTTSSLATKCDVASQRSWELVLGLGGGGLGGTLRFEWSTDGEFGTYVSVVSTTGVPATSGILGLRATLDADNGAGGHTVTFYTSTDYVSWTQLGAPVTNAGVTSIFASTTPVVLGKRANDTRLYEGGLLAAEIRSGIGGTVVADFDARTAAGPRYRDAGGNVWTINGSAWTWSKA